MLSQVSKYRTVLNYAIVYFVIGFSGIAFWDLNRVARFGFLLFIGFLFVYYKKKIGKELILLITFVIAIILLQTIYFGAGSLFTTITLTSFLVLTPYFLIKLMGPVFLKYYRDVMVIIALISFGFWIANNLLPGLHSASQGWAQTIGLMIRSDTGMYNDNYIIYTYENMQVYGLYRNPGPFHEPGAYAVFLMLAIVAEIFVTKKLATRNNLLFLVSMITTFSTAGFLGMFFIVGFYVFTSKRMTFLTKLVVFTGSLSIIMYLFLTLEFLGEKINSQFEEQTQTHLSTPTVGRFLGARKALIVLYRYPLFGRGLIAASKADSTSEEAAGYGWMMWVSQIGIVFGFLYMFLIYKSLKNYSIINLNSRLFALFAFLALMAVLSGQKHTSSWVFFMMVVAPMVFPLSKFPEMYSLNEK